MKAYKTAKHAKREAKAAVAVLRADYAKSRWDLKQYLYYLLEQNDKRSALGCRDASPWNRIKADLADRRATELAGPRPALPRPKDVQRAPRRELKWSTWELGAWVLQG